MMDALIVTPQFIDFILIGLVAEFLLLSIVLWARGGVQLIAPLFLFLASGAAIFVALRASVAGATDMMSLQAPLLVGFATHTSLIILVALRGGIIRKTQRLR
ncbi:MAG: hypothetical protein AAF224_04475 [Pseudomonadota bacterium]